ncbi:MAG: hypothetical protein A3F09_03530 [Chlamydiae bacterium RIFCSPHIGHO2_12_FULL_49_11]|nr:MAG: hypothetical protein A3F09_03530 [Chlamydiae bacterium RIFCSPHIGHO2_12_FULL_49_11]
MFSFFERTATLSRVLDHIRKPNPAAVILDVRTPEEYDSLHLKTGLNCPIQSLPENLERLAQYDTFFVHCAHGYRGTKACRLLAAKWPEKEILLIAIPIEEWPHYKIPTEKGPC